MRTAFNIYRTLWKYVEEMDAAAQAQGKGPEDRAIDADFRSGVYLGVGLSNLILSMMPSRLLSLIELFGYKGDRHLGLQLLNRAGGWTKASNEPSVSSGMVSSFMTCGDIAERSRPCRSGRRAPHDLRHGARDFPPSIFGVHVRGR